METGRVLHVASAILVFKSKQKRELHYNENPFISKIVYIFYICFDRKEDGEKGNDQGRKYTVSTCFQ